jgi:hypothetical protein
MRFNLSPSFVATPEYPEWRFANCKRDQRPGAKAFRFQRGEEYRFDGPKLRRSGVAKWQMLQL